VFDDKDHDASYDKREIVDQVHVDNVPQGGNDDREGGVTGDAFQGGVEFPGFVRVVKEGRKEAVFIFSVYVH
jgi:hypothetical protein